MIWKIWKKGNSNSDMIWKIWKKSEKIRKIWKKSNLKSDKIWEIQKKGKLNSEKDIENTEEKQVEQ